MPNEEAEPIFGPYLQGLVLLSKADVHLSIEAQARDAFVTTLRRAMRRFGDMETEYAPLLPALHRVMQRVIPDEAHRNQVFGGLEKVVNKASVTETVDAKRAADLYLAIVAHRLWPDFVKRANDRAQPTQA